MKKLFTIILFSFACIVVCLHPYGANAQGTWLQKANFGGSNRMTAVGFSIGTKGYIGTGHDASGPDKDFWEWDQAINVWTQKADFGGGGRQEAVGFSIGTKGYIATGFNNSTYYQDVYEYNPSANSWTQKANFGGAVRNKSACFSIGTKGYIGTGQNQVGAALSDFWEYNQSADSWTQKASYGGGARTGVTGLSIGTKGYFGMGADNLSVIKKDFWEYDPANNTWTQKADFGGGIRKGGVGFSIGTRGYVGTGADTTTMKNDLWEYYPGGDTWIQKLNFPGGVRVVSVGFSIGAKGYIGTGFDGINFTNDLWEYSPPCNLTLTTSITSSTCGQANGTASVTVTGGMAPYTYQWTNGDQAALADSLPANLYMVTVTDAVSCSNTKSAMVVDAGGPVITVNPVTNVSCHGGNNGAISISVTGGTLPYTYFWDNGGSTTTISNLSAGPYEVGVLDASGCKGMKSVLVTQPTAITLTVSKQNASCGNADGSASVVASGGTGAYTYLWSNAATTTSTTGLSAGNYSVTVTDNNGCSDNAHTPVFNIGGATITLDSIKPAGCGSGGGSIYVSVTGGAPPYTYIWSNGATTQDITGIAPGTYNLVVHGTNSCNGAFNATIPSQTPYTPVICMVTVDTTTGTNQCVFVKDSIANKGIAHYNIYRETTTSGVYQYIGARPAHLLSLWTDPSANPSQRAWRYKLSSVDTCGVESPISTFHKTIHLSSNIGLNNVINLAWDNYEGFNYGTYYIWRYHPSTNWVKLDSISGNPNLTYNSYTDLTPPSLINLHYFIAVANPNGCNPTLKYPEAMTIALNSSRSNIYKINTSLTSVNDFSIADAVSIYPNPTCGKTNLIISQFEDLKINELKVYNVFGECIYQSANFQINSSSNLQIDLKEAPAGIYFLQIKTSGGTAVKKIVKE